jgi:hypothetical protein
MDSIKIWRAARRFYRAEHLMARAQASADAARATLQVAASQSDDGGLTAGGYRIVVDTSGAVAVTILPMLRGDQLDLPYGGESRFRGHRSRLRCAWLPDRLGLAEARPAE